MIVADFIDRPVLLCYIKSNGEQGQQSTIQVERDRIPLEPITRARIKKFRDPLQVLVRTIQDQEIVLRDIEDLEGNTLLFVHLIQLMKSSNSSSEARLD